MVWQFCGSGCFAAFRQVFHRNSCGKVAEQLFLGRGDQGRAKFCPQTFPITRDRSIFPVGKTTEYNFLTLCQVSSGHKVKASTGKLSFPSNSLPNLSVRSINIGLGQKKLQINKENLIDIYHDEDKEIKIADTHVQPNTYKHKYYDNALDYKNYHQTLLLTTSGNFKVTGIDKLFLWLVLHTKYGS